MDDIRSDVVDAPTLTGMDDWIPIEEAAELVGKDAGDLYDAMRRGEVRGLLVGETREWRVDRAAAIRWAGR